ncbi:MAG: hypothetical protein PSY14_02620 [bacterium]|nr:hypothetical protein [bacterium]
MTGKKPASKLRKGLTAIFMTAVLGGTLLMGQSRPIAQNDNLPAPVPVTQTIQSQPAVVPQVVEAPYAHSGEVAPYQSRALTAGEREAVTKIFGGQLNPDSIRVHFFKDERPNLRSGVIGENTRDIEFYGEKNASADFSRDKGSNFGSFVYELTRLWQNSTEGKFTKGDNAASNYKLDDDTSFVDYGQKQQAKMMEDYARRFLHPDRKSFWREGQPDNSETDPQLEATVEEQFPEAAAAREAFADVDIRKLTEGEARILKGIFGETINIDTIRANMHPQGYDDIVGSVDSGKLEADFWGPENSSKDFSTEKNAYKFGTFVHELTHVWQNQTERKYTNESAPVAKDKYTYTVSSKSKFEDYRVEQQAAIIEDYARRFLHPSKSFTYLDAAYKDAESMSPLLKKIVETAFPSAKTLREAYELETAPRSSPVPVASYKPAKLYIG